MMMPSLSEILPIVRQAGKLLLERRNAEQFQTKAPQDFVTEVDFAVQRAICDALKENWPEIQFMGEERDNSDIDFTLPYWVLDPVDGTTNLIHGFHHSVISLALLFLP